MFLDFMYYCFTDTEFIWSMTLDISLIYLLNVANDTYSTEHLTHLNSTLTENALHVKSKIQNTSSYLSQLLLLN